MTFQQIFSGEIVTSDTKKPDSANFTQKNPLKSNVFVNGIELILSPEFSQKGAIVIMIDGIMKFNSAKTKIKGYAKFPIPLKQEILRDVEIEVFAWNKEDTNVIECSLNLSMSSEPQPFNSQAVPLSPTILNQFVSDDIILFPNATRNNTDETKLIFMEGYKKLLVALAAAPYAAPVQVGINSQVVDGDLNTKYTDSTGFGSGGETRFYSYVDFGDNLSRIVAAKVESSGSFQSITWTLQGDNDSSFPSPTDVGSVVSSNGNPATVTGSAQTFRYYRLKAVSSGGGAGGTQASIYEIYDSNGFGGTASLSFETLNPDTNAWTEFIAASEFGTITDGNSINAQIGDVITKSISGKTYALPSTQTGFRARLVVTGGGMAISVSAQRVL